MSYPRTNHSLSHFCSTPPLSKRRKTRVDLVKIKSRRNNNNRNTPEFCRLLASSSVHYRVSMLGVSVSKHSRRAKKNAASANVRASTAIKALLQSCGIREVPQLSIIPIVTAAMRLWLNVYFSTTWGLEQVLCSLKDNLQTVNQFLPIWKGGGGPPWSSMSRAVEELGHTWY